MHRIDLNCDLGESFGAYEIGADSAIIPHISSANIACGVHAGDASVMERTVALAAASGVSCGAHPGLPDLAGFGRREMAVSPAEAKALVLYQIGALEAFCRARGVPLSHVKAHGALYNMAEKNIDLARAICEAAASFNENLVILGLAGSEMETAARETGLRFAREVFADRAYEDDGSLVSRAKSGAMIEDADLAIKRVIRMIVEKKVESIHGKDIAVEADSVCVHGDGEKALDFVLRLRDAFVKARIDVVPFMNIA